jgi:hypothetical protein
MGGVTVAAAGGVGTAGVWASAILATPNAARLAASFKTTVERIVFLVVGEVVELAKRIVDAPLTLMQRMRHFLGRQGITSRA